jgi:DcmR-like sensory protein
MTFEEILLSDTGPQQHLVQLCWQSAGVTRSVGRYLSEGLKRGETALVLAATEHLTDLCEQLTGSGLNPYELQQEGRLAALDARQTLAKFMVDNKPNARLFDESVGTLARRLGSSSERHCLRAYGEMVGLLWLNRQFSAAMALEELWNDLLQSTSFSLFCSYPIDVFDPSFHRCDVDAVMCSHTHMVPPGFGADLELAVSRAVDETIGAQHRDWRALFQAADKPAWGSALRGEALILWLRENFAEHADDILVPARAYFERAGA